MSIAILCIGTELVRGQVVNKNGSTLADALATDGHEVFEILCVDDDVERIVRALARLAETNSAVICTGGLGPTTDDLTRQAAAQLLGVALQRDEASRAAIAARFAKYGRQMLASNEQQADFPEGATILANPHGTAPGFSVQHGKATCFFMPGVPSEMQAMFDSLVRPALAETLKHITLETRLMTFGLPESDVNERLQGLADAHGVSIGYRAASYQVEVKIWTRADSREEAAARLAPALEEAKRRLGEARVVSDGSETLAASLGKALATQNLLLGVAESCTGGLVAELVTSSAGASRFFAGGVVSYANHVKAELLAVPQELLEEYGAVSEQVARAMAEGALSALSCDVALATTGIAGPEGGTPEKPVGLVHFAVARRGGDTVHQLRTFPGDRNAIQRRAALFGLWLTRERLRNGSIPPPSK